MTSVQKVFGLLTLQAAIVAGSYGGAYYTEHKKTVAAQQETEKAFAALSLAHARSSLVEATLGIFYNNYGLAFERVVRAQTAAQTQNLGLGKYFDEVTALLVGQNPTVKERLLDLADRVEPPPPLVPKEFAKITGTPSAPAAKPAGTAAGPGTPPAPTAAPGAVAAAPTAPGPGPAVAPVGQPVNPAAVAPRTSPSGDRSFQEGREALLQAKVLLLAGDTAQVATKLAVALTMLNESGHSELDEELAAAIKAARSKDEAKTKAAIEAALTHLRSL